MTVIVLTLIFGAVMGLLNTKSSSDALYCMVAPAPLIVRPAPSAAALSAALSANTRFLSLRDTVVELIVVCVPSTCRLPSILTVPVLSPTVAGSIIKLAGPRSCPSNVMLPAAVSSTSDLKNCVEFSPSTVPASISSMSMCVLETALSIIWSTSCESIRPC